MAAAPGRRREAAAIDRRSREEERNA